jgi:lipoyl(octanoyl) transferase
MPGLVREDDSRVMNEGAVVNELLVAQLGTLPYAAALEFQRDVARRRISGEIPEDVLLLVEHPPVVTLGRTAKGANLIASPEYLAAQGVELFEVERGGDITFHGPGQLVGYPIFDLKRHRKDLHWYLRQVEEALIQAIDAFGITGGRVDKYTGVWVDASRDSRRKIASIGVHARDWVTWHGFALNVNTDLRYFDLIVPCGISGVTMTSVARELQSGSVEMHAVHEAVVSAFGRTFGLAPRQADVELLGSCGASADLVTGGTNR